MSHRQDDPVFDALPVPTLLLDTDLRIKAANRAYQAAVRRTADELLDMPLFEAFPDNPDDPTADGVANLSASLERVARRRRTDDMLAQRYDIRDSTSGEWLRRVWQPRNSPVLDGDRVAGLVHQVEDVTPCGEDLHRALVGYRDALTASAPTDARTRELVKQVDVVAAMLRHSHQLADEVMHLRRALSSRAVVDQAKGMIMAERRCSAEEAFQVLTKLSSETNVRVADVALALVYQAQEGQTTGS
ncbi:ANTAR domain-containing protein [Nocardioides sp. SYSU DS0651]|uniref:ANTAR domain-containing protein n=1 Tax=Nocardioides sp. SYSU DS0651 TaxID=3415955 RepID=UPI003F4C7F86